MARNGKGMMQLWEGMKIIMQSTRDEAGGEHGGCFPLLFQLQHLVIIDLRSFHHAAGNICLTLR